MYYPPRVFCHMFNSHKEIYGYRLTPGDIIESGDVFSGPDGTWERCAPSLYGTSVPTSTIVFIRPLPVLILGRTNTPKE